MRRSKSQVTGYRFQAKRMETRSFRNFTVWLKENIDKLPVAKEQIEEILIRRQR